jgi:serpin B
LLSVNEKGTIGAAATSVGVVPTISVNSPPPIPFVMVVNRPFIAAVLDRGTGAVPFIAAVNDPRG